MTVPNSDRSGVPPFVDPAAGEALVADRIERARSNRELGWCPCGDERDGDCECFGTYRLSATQGLVPVLDRAMRAASDDERPEEIEDDDDYPERRCGN